MEFEVGPEKARGVECRTRREQGGEHHRSRSCGDCLHDHV